MRNLTTADVAFLLCTSSSKQGSPGGGNRGLTLQIDYGLVLELGADGSISVSLQDDDPESEVGGGATASATTPTKVSPLARFPAALSFQNTHPTSIDEILRSPITPTTPFDFGFPPTPAPALLPPTPASSRLSRQKPQNRNSKREGQEGYKYRISTVKWERPDTNSFYMWYNSTGNQQAGESNSCLDLEEAHRALEGETLEKRYGSYAPEWFDSYLDWIERAERSVEDKRHKRRRQQRHHRQRVEGVSEEVNKEVPFEDEGERTLWMVEGLLLACWLCLQPDVDSVEYQPVDGEEVYLLEGESVGRVVKGFLDSVG